MIFTCLCVGGGVLGSVATIESGTTYYTTVYNYDSTVDGVNTFRFTCIVCHFKPNIGLVILTLLSRLFGVLRCIGSISAN